MYVVKLMFFLAFFIWLLYFSGVLFLRNAGKEIHSTRLGLGILLMYVLPMLLGNIKVALGAQVVLGLVGNILILINFSGKVAIFLRLRYLFWFVLVTGFSLLILQFPVRDWDARSIWFYHAKVIYFTNDIWALGAWKEHAQAFSHIDYPNLFPLLAAQSANFFGLWNEYVPKLGLSILSMPIFLYAFEYSNRKSLDRLYNFRLLLMIFTLFFFDGAGYFLMSGYMDGWLAVYAFCTTLIAADTVKAFSYENSWERLPNFVVFCAILSQIKQEGMAIVIIIMSVSIMSCIFSVGNIQVFLEKIRRYNLLRIIYNNMNLIVIIILSMGAWTIGFHLQGGSVGQYSGNVFERIIVKLSSPGVFSWIFANVFFHNSMMIFALITSILSIGLILILNNRFLTTRIHYADFISLYSGIIYSCLLILVYLSTSADVFWHMSCSAGRVGLSASMMIMAFNFRVISEACSNLYSR